MPTHSTSRWFLLLVALAALFVAVACGGDDDDPSDDAGPSDSSTVTSDEPTDDDDSDDAPSSDDGGTGVVEISGVERFTFDVTCQFGTGIVKGPGKHEDGTDAYVTAGFPVDDAGKPLSDPEEVSILVKVGIAEQLGQADYEWVLGDTAGIPGSLENDGERASGTAELEYRNNGANPPIPHGETRPATFEFNCP